MSGRFKGCSLGITSRATKAQRHSYTLALLRLGGRGVDDERGPAFGFSAADLILMVTNLNRNV